MELIISLASFAILALLWLGFWAAMLFNRQMLVKTWQSFRRLPLLVRLALALLFLPVVLGLWIWHTSWPAWLRLALVTCLVVATMYTFFPQLPLS